jgi:hypothetical protein
LIRLRAESGLSFWAFAHEIDIGTATLNKWSRGRTSDNKEWPELKAALAGQSGNDETAAKAKAAEQPADTGDKFYEDRPDCVLEALRYAAYLVERGPRRPGSTVDVSVVNGKVCYSDGCAVFRVTFTTRNFMDDRREALMAMRSTTTSPRPPQP